MTPRFTAAVESTEGVGHATINVPTIFVPTPVGEYRVPAEIDATGGREVTGELVAFYQSLPPLAVVHFPDFGRYRCDYVLQPYARVGIRTFGHGSEIFSETSGAVLTPDRKIAEVTLPFQPAALNPGGAAYNSRLWPRNRIHLHVRYSTDMEFEGLGIRGPRLPDRSEPFTSVLEAQSGVQVDSCPGFRWDGPIVGVWGDAVYLTGNNGHWSRDVEIRGRAENIGRQGITGRAVADADVSMDVDGVQRSLIDLEPPGLYPEHGVLGFRYHHFSARDFRNDLIACGGGTYAIDRIVVEDGEADNLGVTVNVAGVRREYTDPDGTYHPPDRSLKGSFAVRRCRATRHGFSSKNNPRMRLGGARSVFLEDLQEDVLYPQCSGYWAGIHPEAQFSHSGIDGGPAYDPVNRVDENGKPLPGFRGVLDPKPDDQIKDGIVPRIAPLPEGPPVATPYPLPVPL